MHSGIMIVSLGSGDPELMNGKSLQAFHDASSVVLRTGKHPFAKWLKDNGLSYTTLDTLYDEADCFDDLNSMIADRLIQLSADSVIVYAVADAYTDSSVRWLLQHRPDSVQISVIPSVGFHDLYLSSSVALLNDSNIQISSAYDLLLSGFYNPNISLLITEIDNEILAGQVKIFLSDRLDEESTVYLFGGDTSHSPVPIKLYELDRQNGLDHRSSLLVPGSDCLSRSRHNLEDLENIMETLRSDHGCPWDRIQTHDSLKSYLIEEAWECVAAIDQDDQDHLCEELGDLLFQIIFHASIGKAFDEFTLNDIISTVCNKMIRRHPHVFADTELTDPSAVSDTWEQIKQSETGNDTVLTSLEDVSSSLPSLKYASKTLRKLDKIDGTHRPPDRIVSDIQKQLNRIGSGQQSPETSLVYGSLLLLCCELCYRSGLDSEVILHQTVDHLKSCLSKAETRLLQDGKSLEHLTFEELCVYLKYVEGEIE